jgi:RHS repeat-associated protein
VIPGEVTSGGISEFGTHSYYHADGNGNITMLIATSQMIVAKYLYDPFGNTLAKCGLLADVNNYRFSSKEWNGNAGLYYYLYRFYDPNLQRWVNRDPIQNEGSQVLLFSMSGRNISRFYSLSGLLLGPDLYIFNDNDPEDFYDPLGLIASPSSGSPGGAKNPPSNPASTCDTNPCPGFKSKWPPYSKFIPQKWQCGAAKMACDAGCYEYEGDVNCSMKCANDCYDNMLKCAGKIITPKPKI